MSTPTRPTSTTPQDHRRSGHAPQAILCIEAFHAVKLVTDALEVARRAAWNELRRLPDQAAAKTFKGARWAHGKD